MFDVKFAMEKMFMQGFIKHLKHNKLVTDFIEKTPKLQDNYLFNLEYLLSDNVPNLSPETLVPLVLQGTKKKEGVLISMRCITYGDCLLQTFSSLC